MSLAFNFSTARVLVVGDVIFDQYFHGSASRISPEAPVPVVLVDTINARLGGAANVALNVKALGASVTVLGVTGNDMTADQLKTLLEEKGINYRFLTAYNKKTIHKLRVLSQHHQMMRLDQEQSLRIDLPAERDLFLSYFDEALNCHDIVILSDYAKGTLEGLTETLIERAHAQQCPVLIDPKSIDPSCYRGADIVTPNLKEFETWVGPCVSLSAIEAKAKILLKEHKIGCLVLTRSEQGISVFQEDVPTFHVSAQAKEVCDVTGAGDTVIAVLAAGLASQHSMQESIMLANRAAGIVVGKLGTATVTPEELCQNIGQETIIKAGVLDEATLLTQVAAAKLRGETIVFTNGCFDLLHAGHVSYLNEAKTLGNRLIVAVNTDSSVKKLKGETRPIHSEDDRMLLLANLKAVDWVVPFSDDTPSALIEKISPDIMVKGGDYTDIYALPGASHVLRKGGRVEILSLKPGRSTTNTVRKIQEKTLYRESNTAI
jgi:D-beta-D-heptose 7-phosphate kinase/D-beta-D-heptose 1-phosphate adenosyltransferase